MNCRNARVFAFAFASIIFASINSASAQIVALGHSAVRGNVAESEMWPSSRLRGFSPVLRWRYYTCSTAFLNISSESQKALRCRAQGTSARSR
jgi:hypothetical protein